MARLTASGTVVALNLLGAVSEQPDFLVHTEALPYVVCLRADSDWKHAPQKSFGHKVSPLVLELWNVLDKVGGLTMAEARETLGRELTDAAVLRALCELWQGLRISPVLGEAGQPARWELLRVRHRGALSIAIATSQVTALSLLVSTYLQSVYAATGEEIEIFLSPVASRSRVREAVRGLSATRQIQSLSMDAQTYFFLEDGLAEFTPAAPRPTATAEPVTVGTAARGEQVPLPAPPLGQRRVKRTEQEGAVRRNDQAARPMRPAAAFRPGRPPGVGRPYAASQRGSERRPDPNAAPRSDTRTAPRTDSKSDPKSDLRGERRPGGERKPAAAAGWKSPRRPTAPWQPGAARAARRERTAANPVNPADNRAGSPRREIPQTAAQAGKPAGAWSGVRRPERPAPWARPGQNRPGSGQPHRAGRGDSPVRPAGRPGRTASGQMGSARGPGFAPSRAPGRYPAPPAAGGNPGPFRGRSPGRSGSPRGVQSGSGRATTSEAFSMGGGRGENRGAQERGGGPRPGSNPRSGKPVRSFGPGSRPSSARPFSAARSGTFSQKPQRKGGAKPGGKPGQPPAGMGGRKPPKSKSGGRKPGV